MKRVFSFLLAVLLLLLPGAAASAEPSVIPITDAEGLQAIRANPWGSYRLEKDIDMSGVDWTPVPFKGQMNGLGHTIYNLSVKTCGAETRTVRDGDSTTYDAAFAGLFSTVEYAEISDLHLRGVSVEIETDRPCAAAALAGYVDHASVSRCSVEGRVRVASTGIMAAVGGLAGYGCGSFSDSGVEVELQFEDRGGSGRFAEFMGGVLACGVADIDRNTVSVRGYAVSRGTVRNGGLVGLYARCGMSYEADSVRNNEVSGTMSYFADNPERRAWCAAFLGEHQLLPRRYSGNRDGLTSQAAPDAALFPEKCAEPDYVDEVTAPGCDSWGHTRHTCRVCGYSWVDSYTPPQHTPGQWRVSVQPTVTSEGQEQLRCAVCDTLLDERVIPVLVRVESCRLDRHRARLYIDTSLRLSAEVKPDNASNGALRWSSSDPSVATVDEDGLVRAVGRGTALITAQTADGYGRDTCSVTVSYSLIQWLRSVFTGRA